MAMAGCGNSNKDNREGYINYISFSPDGKKLIFDRQRDGVSYMINVYDLKTKRLGAYQPPKNEQWSMASYSPDGNKIVFSIIPCKGNRLDLNKMQIAIMDTDGRNIRKITNSDGPKIYPSFSRSGDKVLFAKAGIIRTNGNTPATDYDIFEVGISSGKETQLTWLKLFSLTRPSYFPDNERIIFSTYVSGNDDIYIIKKGATSLPKPLIRNEPGFRDPLISYKDPFRDPVISNDGTKIYFSALALKPGGRGGEGAQMYLYANDGRHRRVTGIFALCSIFSAALSPDGQYVAIVVGGGQSRYISFCGIRGNCPCNVKEDTGRMEFLPLQPRYIINQHN